MIKWDKLILPMRIAFIILTVIALVAAAVYQFGGALLTRRMRVIDHRWQIPPGEPVTLTEALAIKATESALRASSREPAAWLPVAIPWTTGSVAAVHIYKPTEASIALSNRNSPRPEIYSHLRMDVKKRVVRVELYRAK